MNLKILSEKELLLKTKTAVHEERLSTIKVLHHFREIERRRTFMGYPSLFELAVKYFGYSASAAQRRIASMRLLKTLPQFETQIESGALSLTAASSAQSYFRRSSNSREEKISLIQSCLNKSAREVEKEIKKREPERDKRSDIRYTSENRLRMSINISEATYEKLEKLKYKLRCSSIEDVIDRLADKALDEQSSKPVALSSKDTSLRKMKPDCNDAHLLPAPAVQTRHIPSVTKKIVLKRTEQKCSYRHPQTGQPCDEIEKLEFDHIHPYSKGGAHLPENLRLLCSHHNKLVWQTEQKNI